MSAISLSFGGNSTETPFLPVSGGQTMLRHVDMDRSRRSHRLSRCGTWVCPCMSRYVHVDFVKGSLVEKLPSHGVSPPPPHHIITTSHLISPHLTTPHQNITPHQRITAHILWANSFLGLLVLSPLKLPPPACPALLVRL